ncbi:hypothetical protein CLROS_034090 [Clostridium felsineum]|uniref:Uncharacterized protein n=1 Tax=Clostridium felsineum TaxID=36839 RepID=A0A1S8L8D7_9CLOT|nr:hypothetical protein CLROS_034090 [Clostridium felsineum]URZ13074.1 hypothetical protein CROST_038240 [Clostridium felsineum]
MMPEEYNKYNKYWAYIVINAKFSAYLCIIEVTFFYSLV